MAKPRLRLLEDGYKLEVNGQSSEEADYGDPVELRAGGIHYLAFVSVGDDGEVETPLDFTVYRVHGGEDAEVIDESGDETDIAPEPGADVADEPEEIEVTETKSSEES